MTKLTCVCIGCSDECDTAGDCEKWKTYYNAVEGNVEYPDKLVGEIVGDWAGAQWKRTNRRDMESTYPDSYYYMPVECHCDVVDNSGYTHHDEHGPCDHCESKITQINGHNDGIDVDFDDPTLFD